MGKPKSPTRVPIDAPLIDELAGYVNKDRAMAIMGIASHAHLNSLVKKGVIKVVKWDERTLMYDKRSVEKFHRERAPRQSKAEAPDHD